MSEGAGVGAGAWKCVVGVATTDSHERIYATLERLRDELLILPGFRAELVVAAHGAASDARTASEVRRFAASYPDVALTLLPLAARGQNRAINALVEHARETGAELIHFFDDDVRLEPGSLELNLRALVATAQHRPRPILVGSHVLAVPHSLAHFRRLQPTLAAALQGWFWHHVFALPLRPDVERPRFCSSESLGMWVESVPELPPDETRVASAPFLSNYCAVACRQVYENAAFLPLVKPQRSIAYVEVPCSLATWREQQQEMCIGVVMADACFAEHAAFLAELFAWPFALRPSSVRPPRRLGLARRALRALHRGLLASLMAEAEAELERARRRGLGALLRWPERASDPTDRAAAPISGVATIGAGLATVRPVEERSAG